MTPLLNFEGGLGVLHLGFRVGTGPGLTLIRCQILNTSLFQGREVHHVKDFALT